MPEGLRAGDESASEAFPIRNRRAKGWCISGRSWVRRRLAREAQSSRRPSRGRALAQDLELATGLRGGQR